MKSLSSPCISININMNGSGHGTPPYGHHDHSQSYNNQSHRPLSQSYSHGHSSADQQLFSSPPSLLRRSHSASEAASAAVAAAKEAAHYSRQAQHIVARHQQQDGNVNVNPTRPRRMTTSVSPSRPPALMEQQRSRSISSTPTARLSRYSFPNITPSTSAMMTPPAHQTPSPSRTPSRATTPSYNHHPSSTRSDNTDTSYAVKFQKLRMEHGKLQEYHQALSQDNVQLKSQTEELETKTVQLEARLLESMQARSGREKKFQDEMKRQRGSMNTLFTELADSKRQVQVLQKQLRDTNSKLALQQALTANTAFQLEQEELEYQMEEEQAQEQEQQQNSNRKQPQHVGVPSEAGYDYYTSEQDDTRSTVSSQTRDSGFSRVGNYFNRRRVPNGSVSSAGASVTSSTAPSSFVVPSKQQTTDIGHFQSYEESKHDLFVEQVQYGGAGAGQDVRPLFDLDTTTTATGTTTTDDNDYLQKVTPTLPKMLRQPPVKDKPKQQQKQHQQQEMNYGQTSAGMPPAAPMSRLDRIRQKRRNLESMFRKNGAGSTISSGNTTANSSLSSSNSSSFMISPPTTVLRGTANFRARSKATTSPNRNLNHNLVNLMNHRRNDD